MTYIFVCENSVCVRHDVSFYHEAAAVIVWSHLATEAMIAGFSYILA